MDDAPELKQRQQQKLLHLSQAATQVGRELLVEIIASKHGPVDQHTASGMHFRAVYRQGILEGAATCEYADGTILTGKFLHGKMDGKWTAKFADGKQVESVYDMGATNDVPLPALPPRFPAVGL